MNKLTHLVWTAVTCMVMGVALAQPVGGQAPGAGPAASGAMPGMGTGMGGGRGWARWGADYTPGWALMTPKERDEHREHMRSMKTYEECKAYQAQHHEQMAQRAKERGGKALGQPRHAACGGLNR